jgi:uncharacterized protein
MEYGAYRFDERIELKGLTEAKEGTFTGYASTFRNEDLQGDVVMPGAFSRTIKKSKGVVPVLMAHNPGRIVGTGMSAEEDSKGLAVAAAFSLSTKEGQEGYKTVLEADENGLKLGLSIGYYIPDGGAMYDEKRGVRLLKDIDLFEYSIAATPANPRATITGVKTYQAPSKRELEQMLRECGLSGREAMAVLSNRDAAAVFAKGFEELGRDGVSSLHAAFSRDGSNEARRDGVTQVLNVRSGAVLAAELRAVMLGR